MTIRDWPQKYIYFDMRQPGQRILLDEPLSNGHGYSISVPRYKQVKIREEFVKLIGSGKIYKTKAFDRKVKSQGQNHTAGYLKVIFFGHFKKKRSTYWAIRNPEKTIFLIDKFHTEFGEGHIRYWAPHK